VTTHTATDFKVPKALRK